MRDDRSLSLLVVDDDASIRRVFTELIAAKEEVEVQEAKSAEAALEALRQRPFDVAFVDIRMPGGLGGMDLLERLKRDHLGVEVVMVTAHGSIESAVQAMKMGAADYLPKPFKLDQVSLILRRVRRVRNLQSENEHLKEELRERYRAQNLIGLTAAMEKCHDLIDRIRRVDCNVLILGESGTGKDLIARAIHYDGPRRDRMFVPIDCGAIHASLLESELFGHEKGAFTGAHARKAGLFEVASGGTVFLDEIGEIPLELQAALLRVIEQKEIRPLGATGYRPVDVRIIAATNRSLDDMVAQGKFRQDLFYRLNVVTVPVPPLRERRDDIPFLVEHILKRFAGRPGMTVRGVSPSALERLRACSWPGNVRELAHEIERACALGSGTRIEAGDLSPGVLEGGSGPNSADPSLEEMEVDAIRRLMRQYGSDTARIAGILKIDRSTLYRKIKRYRIVIER